MIIITNCNPMDTLPHEIISMIMEHLSVRDKCRFALMSVDNYRCNKHVLRWFSMHLQCMQKVSSLKYIFNDRWSARLHIAYAIMAEHDTYDRLTSFYNISRETITSIEDTIDKTNLSISGFDPTWNHMVLLDELASLVYEI